MNRTEKKGRSENNVGGAATSDQARASVVPEPTCWLGTGRVTARAKRRVRRCQRAVQLAIDALALARTDWAAGLGGAVVALDHAEEDLDRAWWALRAARTRFEALRCRRAATADDDGVVVRAAAD